MKRLVFVHGDGLHQILGATDQKIPVVLEFIGNDGERVPFITRGRTIEFASLYKENHRAAYFREPICPAKNTFNEAQK